MNYFNSPFSGVPLTQQVTNPNIIVGEHSYYSGYYHQHSFDECARYLSPDRTDVDKLIIGRYCSIGSGAIFMMAGNQGHRSDWVSTFPFFYQENADFAQAQDGFQRLGDTVIGHDVWIGSEAMIMPGVQVGDGAIIASRAVVTKNVKPYEVVGSNPAKHIKYRFSESQITMLLDMQWWHWSQSQLTAAMTLLCSGDIELLYQYWQQKINF
ncbi:type B chloramphenicol O-acetyltransferase [Shewanella intestini]|uniref:Chloramphenicol acetyltransferase n=1 Tax=Shewanella intestini TaxID=2017544 RepID=A0ABS5I3G4_9GAMM|nr:MULTISPECIES: type B chloramphenicol O-acetyltransferase [Shewanella]MBR9728566.1 type B chloramphenicol O-acetyltransferase [Shewanella intestini]MRG36385.1 type B chloramphenicol O-acetyltransferase [Shewanella sp. XMDDZSB0408]